MVINKHEDDAIFWYIDELTSRVVAASGIITDRFHLGKIILQCLKDAPDFIMQIDGSSGETETFGSVLRRSVKCALSLRKLGLKHGDNIVIMAPNHLHLAIPFYAGLYLGLGLGCVDITLNTNELSDHFLSVVPKAVFCQSEKAADIAIALKMSKLDSFIITFDEDDEFKNFSQLLQGDDLDDSSVENFKANDFNSEETIAFLLATSGTTGLSKAAAITHKNIAVGIGYWWKKLEKFPSPTRLWLLPSPIQWLSAVLAYLHTPILRITRLQSPRPMTVEHAYELINKFKPTYTIMNPNMMTALINPSQRHLCDFTSFEFIVIGGSATPQSLLDEIKKISPKTEACVAYGMSEIAGISFMNIHSIPNSCGQILGCVQVRLVDIHTGKDVTEHNTSGELWFKGPTVFKGYCNNLSLTQQSFSEDGWLKSGDMFYRDENWNFFFVDRIKILLKYKNHQISPVEIENVIRQHPGVFEVAVTGIPHPQDGDLPVACVVRHKGSNVTGQEIEDMVKESLTDSKRLRGGVIFLNELPVTPTSKISRTKLKEIAQAHLKKEKH